MRWLELWLSRRARSLRRLPLAVPALILLLSLAAMVDLWSRMGVYEQALSDIRPKAAAGVVGLELAFSAKRVETLLQGWERYSPAVCPPSEGPEPLLACAKAGVKLDFSFAVAYALFGAALLVLLLRWLKVPIGRFWAAMAFLPLAAGTADLGENLLLLTLLGAGKPAAGVVVLVGLLAALKFFLIAMALVAALAVVGFWLFWREASKAAGKPAPYLISLDEVIERETTYLRSRRHKADLPWDGDPAPVGLALSGGGIRSATLCLGVLSALGKVGLFRRIDYLSTVSGGGYMGTALSSLLSCKALRGCPGADRPEQYRFGAGDRPHFGVTAPADGPFHDDLRTPAEPHRRWLSGRMVVLHLRAFGEYLVRRPRAHDRDVLRALGTVLTGILAGQLLFLYLLLIAAAVALLGVAVTGGVPLPALDAGVLGYLGRLAVEAGGWRALVAAAVLGGLFALGAGAVCRLCTQQAPWRWFRRGGDTCEEARQRRALWVLGVLALPAAFASPALVGSFLPGVCNGLLLPAFFFGGGALAAALGYVVRVALAPASRELSSSRDSRSFFGSVIGLFLYLVLAASVLVALTVLLGTLIDRAQPDAPPGPLAGGGRAALIGALISGLLAWWRSREAGVEGSVKIGWARKSADFVQKLVLGLAVFVAIIAGLAFSMVLVEQILRWFLAGAWRSWAFSSTSTSCRCTTSIATGWWRRSC